jgi:hypothetical protein
MVLTRQPNLFSEEVYMQSVFKNNSVKLVSAGLVIASRLF